MAEWTTNEINKLLQDVHSGKTHLFNLPKVVYNRVGEELTSAVFEAFNLDADTNLLNPDFETARQLKRNCYVFSAAKTFQQVKDMQNFLFDEKGFKRPFNDFNKAAEGIFNTYNRTWLEAEYETALSQAESASEWERIQAEKDIFPLLRYKTVEDGSVRQEHQTLNNVVRPVGDPFWSRYTPPNGWRCRCFLEQLEEDEAPITEVVEQGGKTYRRNRRWLQEVEQPTKLFDFNPAEKGVIFRDDAQGKGLSHPYFKVDTRWDVHKRNNFGLPLPHDVKDFSKFKTVEKQKVKVTTKKVKPTVLKTTPVEVVEAPIEEVFIPFKNTKEAKKYVEDNIKTEINIKGATLETLNDVIPQLEEIEQRIGNKIPKELKITFDYSKVLNKQSYGIYNPDTKTIHLKKNITAQQKKAVLKFGLVNKAGKPLKQATTGGQTLIHEIGHAIDHENDWKASRYLKNLHQDEKGQWTKVSLYGTDLIGQGYSGKECVAENFTAWYKGTDRFLSEYNKRKFKSLMNL